MTAKPILRVGKIHATGRSTPASVQGHLARARPTPNADPNRSRQNVWLIGSAEDDLAARITGVMRKAGIDPERVRKDAVLANDMLLSVSPEWFRPGDPEAHGTWDDARLKAFTAEAQTLLKRTFGSRVVSAVLHLDEATPHIQAVIVPVMRRKDDAKGFRLSGRDMFGPEQLGRLQQDWEDRLRPHGVGPRQKGSRATHTTLREYYGALEAFRAEDGRQDLDVAQPPQKRLLEAPGAYQGRVDTWRKAEAKRLRDELRPLAVQASRGRLYDAERRRTTELRAELATAAADLGEVRLALVETQDQLAVTKDQVARLRATPINAVAAALGFTGEIRPKENAIDLVKRVGELEYGQAVTWLAQRFGAQTAATAVREHALPGAVAAAAAEPVTTKAERVKARLVAQQLDALAAPTYRVTVMSDRDGKRVGRNIGKARDGTEKLFTRDEVIGLVPRLTVENARGGNVFLTPIDPAVHHVLADDLTATGLDDMRRRGYAPALTLETSPGNHQAVLKVPVGAAPKESVNEWFKDLNRDVGDAKITGLIHPFRLAGFENRKDKHQGEDGRFPFVRVVEAVNRLCGRATELVRAYAARQAETDTAHRRR